MTPRPGEIYWAYVEGTKPRPVIIVSREELNRGHYVLAIPLTSAKLEDRLHLPNCVALRAGQFGLDRDCVAQAEAMTVLDKGDLDVDAGPLDSLDQETIHALIKAVGYVISADCHPLV